MEGFTFQGGASEGGDLFILNLSATLLDDAL